MLQRALVLPFAICLMMAQVSAASNYDGWKRGLIHWWKFDGNADDSAGDLSATPVGPISYVDEDGHKGIDFDGSTTGIDLPPVRELQFRKSFSITVWAKLRSYPDHSRIWPR